jgi:glutamate--cysteine ligase
MTLFQEMDQDRSGAPLSLLETLYAPDAGMGDIISWILDRQVLTIKRNNAFVNVAGKTFRDLIDDPDPRIGGVTFNDFQTHISSTWIIARPDHYRLESRMIGVGAWKTGAFGALLRGILHAEKGIDRSLEVIETLDFTPDDLHDAIDQCGKHGLETRLAGQSYREVMSEIVEIASDNLSSPEQGLLSPLKDMLESGMTDSDLLKNMYEEASSDREYRDNLEKIMGDINYISRVAPTRVTNLHALNYDTCGI